MYYFVLLYFYIIKIFLRHFLFIDGLLHIWKYEGLKQLWAGTLPSLMLVANPAIQFMTYESIKRKVAVALSGRQTPAWIFFVIGAIAKTIATSLTYPLQLVQTKLRVRQYMIIVVNYRIHLLYAKLNYNVRL